MYAKIVDGGVAAYPYTIAHLKADHPITSFPETMSDAMLQGYGMFVVASAAQPTHDPSISFVAEGTPTLVDGKWTQTWQVRDYELEIQQRNVRQEREKLLFDTGLPCLV
jgi:hypothetical protein